MALVEGVALFQSGESGYEKYENISLLIRPVASMPSSRPNTSRIATVPSQEVQSQTDEHGHAKTYAGIWIVPGIIKSEILETCLQIGP